MNEWFILKVTLFQGITEVQNKIQCSKRTKQSRVIQVTILINMCSNMCMKDTVFDVFTFNSNRYMNTRVGGGEGGGGGGVFNVVGRTFVIELTIAK